MYSQINDDTAYLSVPSLWFIIEKALKHIVLVWIVSVRWTHHSNLKRMPISPHWILIKEWIAHELTIRRVALLHIVVKLHNLPWFLSIFLQYLPDYKGHHLVSSRKLTEQWTDSRNITIRLSVCSDHRNFKLRLP